jgi:hypothetical protein
LEVSAASWNGAGAQFFSFVEALLAGAQAHVRVYTHYSNFFWILFANVHN